MNNRFNKDGQTFCFNLYVEALRTPCVDLYKEYPIEIIKARDIPNGKEIQEYFIGNLKKETSSSKTKGSNCQKCNLYNEYVEDNNYICYECKNL